MESRGLFPSFPNTPTPGARPPARPHPRRTARGARAGTRAGTAGTRAAPRQVCALGRGARAGGQGSEDRKLRALRAAELRPAAPTPRPQPRCPAQEASGPRPPLPRPAQKRNVQFLPRYRPAAQLILKETGKEGRAARDAEPVRRVRAGPAAARGRRDSPLPFFSSSAGLAWKCAASSSRSAAPAVPEGRIAAPLLRLRVSAVSRERVGRPCVARRDSGGRGGGLSSGLRGGGRRGSLGTSSAPARTRAALAAGVHTVPGAEAAAAALRRGLPRRLARGGGGRGGWAGRRRDQAEEEGSGGAEEEQKARRREEEPAVWTSGGRRLEVAYSGGPRGVQALGAGLGWRQEAMSGSRAGALRTFPALSLRTRSSRTRAVTQ